nr:hypothetical protein [uncultured Pseudomonas sp.]
MPIESPDAPIRRDASFPFCGRLIALPTSRSLAVGQSLDLVDQVSIDFPAMPDSIELARSTEYSTLSNVIMPDGVHQYKGTRPLEIPFNFRLHAFDQTYCKKGAYTLLQLAARLHSFVLPIDATGGKHEIYARAGAVSGTQEGQLEASASAPNGGLSFSHKGGEKIFNPVTCRLELIFTESDSPGIACIGYVRDVSTKLNGPWLKGPNRSFNLPSSCDFSFTFVHRPGHGNAFHINSTADDFDLQPQAYANTVREKFYNTRALVQVANYRGFADAPANTTTPLPNQVESDRSVFFRQSQEARR